MDDNPYEAPRVERSEEPTRGRERQTGWAVALFLVGVSWIVMVGALGTPAHAGTRGTPNGYWLFLCSIASFPAAAFFRLAWRARR
jgi:hypothetical protein